MISDVDVAKLVFSASLSFCAFILAFLALMINLHVISKQQGYGEQVSRKYKRSIYPATFLLVLGVLSWFSSFLFLLCGGYLVYLLMLVALVLAMIGIVLIAIIFVSKTK